MALEECVKNCGVAICNQLTGGPSPMIFLHQKDQTIRVYVSQWGMLSSLCVTLPPDIDFYDVYNRLVLSRFDSIGTNFSPGQKVYIVGDLAEKEDDRSWSNAEKMLPHVGKRGLIQEASSNREGTPIYHRHSVLLSDGTLQTFPSSWLVADNATLWEIVDGCQQHYERFMKMWELAQSEGIKTFSYGVTGMQRTWLQEKLLQNPLIAPHIDVNRYWTDQRAILIRPPRN